MPFIRRARWACLSLAVSLLCACQSSKSDEQATSAAEKAVAADPPLSQAEALARQFGPIIRGAWVKADYLEAVQRTKSPLRAAGLTGPVSEMLINPARRTADSLVTELGLGNHEGGNMTIYFRPGSQSTALPTNYAHYEAPGSVTELSYRIGNQDTALVLTSYSQGRKVVARAVYRRVRGASLTDLTALNLAVRQLLFAGSYSGTDSLRRPVSMEFEGNGGVKGLKGFHNYDVGTDFGGGADLDFISLDAGTKHQREMAYRFSNDTLRLYAARWAEAEVPTLVRGRLLFQLRRR